MPVLAALELLTSQQKRAAGMVLALSGESTLAALLKVSSPEDQSAFCLYGAVEQCFR